MEAFVYGSARVEIATEERQLLRRRLFVHARRSAFGERADTAASKVEQQLLTGRTTTLTHPDARAILAVVEQLLTEERYIPDLERLRAAIVAEMIAEAVDDPL